MSPNALRIKTSVSPNALIDPAGHIVNYNYENGNLKTVTYQDATSITYLYENAEKHYITGIVDENGDRYATFDYDGDKISSK